MGTTRTCQCRFWLSWCPSRGPGKVAGRHKTGGEKKKIGDAKKHYFRTLECDWKTEKLAGGSNICCIISLFSVEEHWAYILTTIQPLWHLYYHSSAICFQDIAQHLSLLENWWVTVCRWCSIDWSQWNSTTEDDGTTVSSMQSIFLCQQWKENCRSSRFNPMQHTVWRGTTGIRHQVLLPWRYHHAVTMLSSTLPIHQTSKHTQNAYSFLANFKLVFCFCVS